MDMKLTITKNLMVSTTGEKVARITMNALVAQPAVPVAFLTKGQGTGEPIKFDDMSP